LSINTVKRSNEVAIELLGERVRRLRTDRALTLQELANRSDVSVAMLSHIERGRSTPSIKVLNRVGQALDVPFSSFFGEAEQTSESESKTISRSTGRPLLRFDAMNLSKELLSPVRGTQIEMMLLHIGEDGHSGEEPWRRKGEKCGMVIEGTFELSVGASTYQLVKGDAFHFDSSYPHSFRNLHGSETTIMWVIFSKELA